MAKYSLVYEAYSTYSANRGKHVMGIPVGKSYNSIVDARKAAYKLVEHTGKNKDGKYFITIYDETGRFKGEVMNTAYEGRYWYPSNDGVYAAAGKYTLYKNGTLGERHR